MDYDTELEKTYHPENFEITCIKCDGYPEEHDENGNCPKGVDEE